MSKTCGNISLTSELLKDHCLGPLCSLLSLLPPTFFLQPVLLSNHIIPWKFITLSCVYPYPWVSQLLWGNMFQCWQASLKMPFVPYTAKESNPAWLPCALSINETSGFWKAWWVSVSFLPALTWASSSSAGSGAAWIAAQVIQQEKGRTTKEHKENNHSCWWGLCLAQANTWSAQTSTLMMVFCFVLQKFSFWIHLGIY